MANFGEEFTFPDEQEEKAAKKAADDIRKSWQVDLDVFKKIRKKYLLYKDF